MTATIPNNIVFFQTTFFSNNVNNIRTTRTMFFGGLARSFGLTQRRKVAKVLILIDAGAICFYCICCLPFIYARALRFFNRPVGREI